MTIPSQDNKGTKPGWRGACLVEAAMEAGVAYLYIRGNELLNLSDKPPGTEKPEVKIKVLHFANELFQGIKMCIKDYMHNCSSCGNLI